MRLVACNSSSKREGGDQHLDINGQRWPWRGTGWNWGGVRWCGKLRNRGRAWSDFGMDEAMVDG